jgi:hypothetical protein
MLLVHWLLKPKLQGPPQKPGHVSLAPPHPLPPHFLQNCNFVALLLDLFEEFRLLTAGERCLHERCQAAAALFINQRAARWKQHGKCRAIKEGDATTCYFHARATIRRRQCQIRQIMVDGVPLIAHDDKVFALTNYYTMLLGRGSPGHWHFDIRDIYSSMPTAYAQQLVAPFTVSEALQAVRSMNINNAPGPDGFGPAWYVAHGRLSALM